MRDNTNYDKSYEQALKTGNPIEHIDKTWGDPKPYYNEFIVPYLGGATKIVEIGAGLGRYTKLKPDYVQKYYTIEASELCKDFLAKNFNVISLDANELEKVESGIDAIFSFSTMLHFNLFEIWYYIKHLAPKLRAGGHFIVHYTAFESGGHDYFFNEPVNKFGDIGRYIFNSPEHLKIIGNNVRLKCVVDKKPENCLVPVHRVMVFQKV